MSAPRLKANADWMIRQRHAYAKDVPGCERLGLHGLLPPHNIWDSTNWRPWYESNANYCCGLSHYAEVIAELDADAGKKYAAEAQAYAEDILAAVERSFVLSPVIRVRDGTYRSFLPPSPYIRGPAKAPQQVRLRLRHPAAAPITSVSVNGRPWKDFDRAAETVRLDELTGTVAAEAAYEKRGAK